MSRQTQQRSLSKTIATATKSILGMNVPAFTLTHLDNKEGKYGKAEMIVMPYVILGRDSSCNLKFGDSYQTVSRKHAAIERQSENVTVIKQLSESSPTLVNGRPIKEQWFLNNGDTIQLSMEGPRLQFNIAPDGTKKVGFTHRVGLVVKQMEAKHKKTIGILSTLFVLLMIAGGSFSYFKFEDINTKLIGTKEELLAMAEKRKNDSVASADVMQNLIEQRKADSVKHRKDLKAIEAKLKKLNPTNDNSSGDVPINTKVPKEISDQIFFIRIKSYSTRTVEGRTIALDVRWEGTGFLLNDGRFVTARHVLQPWRFLQPERITDADMQHLYANAVEATEGVVTVEYTATSPSGKSFTFTNRDFSANFSNDRTSTISTQGTDFPVILASGYATDWATVQTREKSSMEAGFAVSQRLTSGTKLIALGYSFGGQMQSSLRKLKPLYSESNVAQDGLNEGMIVISNRNFEGGHSGGPMFIVENGKYFVVGIVSAGLESTGFVVPISAIGATAGN